MNNIPVLLITFNRPDYTKQVLDALKQVGTNKLYVFKDGPRPGSESDIKASKEIETIIESIDWPCKVYTLYLNNNLGCGYGPYTAISWIFGREEKAIILEDDCVPSPAFFEFCKEMFERYADDPRVRHIAGMSHLTEHPVFKEVDYIFSQYAQTCGWATWRRTWNGMDMKLRELRKFYKRGGFTNEFATRKEAKFYNHVLKTILNHPEITFHLWDGFYDLQTRSIGQLGIVPARNLVKNIGMIGTHTNDPNYFLFKYEADNDFKATRHPEKIEIIPEYDEEYFEKYCSYREPAWKKIIKRMLERMGLREKPII